MSLNEAQLRRVGWLEAEAKGLRPIPKGLNQAERIFYMEIAAATRLWKVGGMTTGEIAEIERQAKAALEVNYHTAQILIESDKRLQAIERTANAYAKDRNLETAEAFYKAVYGLQ